MDRDAPIVQFINFLLERGRASRVVSIGGISALDLPLDRSRIERHHIDPCSFLDQPANADLLRGAIVLCLATLDSFADPMRLLDALASAQSNADFILLSVKDRVRHSGFVPSARSAGRPIWVAETFAQAVFNAGFNERCLMGYISDSSIIEAKQSFLVVAGRDAAPPAPKPSSVGAPTVAAIINTYNEHDIIEAVVGYLAGQGISVHVLDNWSVDGTYEKCKQLLQSGACASLQRFPSTPSDRYEWFAQLSNTAQFAAKLDADWVLHYDADEIRCSPWRGLSLRDGIAFVDSLGYNAIDFTVLNFAFVDADSPEGFSADALPFYEFGRDPPYFSQIKAWQNRDRLVDLSSTGGHEAIFSDRLIFPIKFLTKHYSLRSQAQATRKIFTDRLPRFASERKRLGWHTQYDYYAEARAVEPWHPWELLRFDEPSFYTDHFLEGITGIGIERSQIVLPSRRTMINVVTSLSTAEIDMLKQTLTARERELADARQQLSHDATKIDTLSQALAAREEELAAREEELAACEEELAGVRQQLSERGLRWSMRHPRKALYVMLNGGHGVATRSTLARRPNKSPLGVKLLAAVRHPLKSSKRKIYRASWMPERAIGFASCLSDKSGSRP